ncbi:MAG: TadE/TadG family type IV pilus assembly protein [Aliihoeflea sp.]|jgi:Flp pilus assembly protein TadG
MRAVNCNKGSTAIEFAILSPVYLLFLLGMIAYGIYLGASHSVQQLASEAARLSVGGLTEVERRTMALDYITNHSQGYAFVDPAKLQVEVADSAADGTRFVVDLRYDARHLPIWGLFDGLVMPSTTIERRSTVRVGGL